MSKIARTAKHSTDKFLPLLAPILTNLIKDAAFKDAVNRGLDAAKIFLDQFVVRLDKLEKQMTAMQHSLDIMVNARKKLGQWPEEDRDLENPKSGPCNNDLHITEVCDCPCGSCTGAGLD